MSGELINDVDLSVSAIIAKRKISDHTEPQNLTPEHVARKMDLQFEPSKKSLIHFNTGLVSVSSGMDSKDDGSKEDTAFFGTNKQNDNKQIEEKK